MGRHGGLVQWGYSTHPFALHTQMLLVISVEVLSKRLKENQLFEDTKFRKMLIIIMFPIVIVNED